MSKRLNAIVNMVPKSRIVADIGCDHGKIAVSLIKNGIAENVICSDISDASLAKAEKLAVDMGLYDVVSFRHGDGLDVLQPHEADAAVIAGMGGELIANILQNDGDKVPDMLVLSCNTAADLLRAWLCDNGFVIVDEDLVYEMRHFYPVILAKRGNSEALGEMALEFGPVLLRSKPKVLKAYVRHRIDLAKGIRSKLNKASKKNKEELIDQIEQKISQYEEVAKCL